MSRSRFRSALLVVLLAGSACHRRTEPYLSSVSRNVITMEELAPWTTHSAWEAISQLRGSFLRSRGPVSVQNREAPTQAWVFLNSTEYGPLESLRNVPVEGLAEIRYYSGTEAVMKFGSRFGAGVIQLVSRNQ